MAMKRESARYGPALARDGPDEASLGHEIFRTWFSAAAELLGRSLGTCDRGFKRQLIRSHREDSGKGFA